MNRTQPIVSPKIDCSDLIRPGVAEPGGAVAAEATGGAPVVSGRFRELQLRPDLSLYAADVRDELDLEVNDVLQPGLLLVLPLNGEADVSYGGRRFQLGGRGGSGGREGLILGLTRREQFIRRLRPGARRRVVSLALGQRWLADHEDVLAGHPGLARLRGTHLAVQQWRLSARLQALAGSLFELFGSTAPLMNLSLESRCLDIAAEALAALSSVDTRESSGLRPRERRRLAEFRAFLDSGEGDGWSMQALADRIGMSPSTLQRYFRQYTGSSVFAYQRRRLLEEARRVLERDGVSVGEAAHIAGYTNAANFATAFRRQFGVAPSELLLRSRPGFA
ncbi:AraC family transcriptional regulator [Methylomonas sp. EFPC3]|uniref:helix-turn-helix transcriptional regulator n=1 Tax=Methylomonas sp. EFPC3 TaxID=3021710 RepID=UPI0024165500|nr:AraC family transcriptional regulator [Methylomonas sp. EFPC3]WFP50548.1 AraC family transcriptional regulator [Methylomonas sp. EFPC3]